MMWRLVALLVVLFEPCLAQTNDSLATTPKLAVRWSPLSLASRFPTMHFGVEYRLNSLNPYWTLSHDIGIVVGTRNDTESYANRRGFKALTELRYYVIPTGRTPFYFSAELYYHRFKYDRTELVAYDCDSGECSYFQYLSWRRTYSMQRAALKAGFVIFLHSEKRLFLDLSAGIGYRVRRSKDPGKPSLPAGAANLGTSYTFFEWAMVEDQEVIGFACGFRLGYRFK